MKELLDKLSSYNIFNYLLPGIIFAVLAEKFTTLSLIHKELVVGVFVYYFLGSIISRIGSVLIEPLLKQIGFVNFAEYPQFVTASKADPRIEVLSEVNNMYRTFVALFVLLGVVKGYEWFVARYSVVADVGPYVAFVFLLILYLVAYRKQTAYIRSRVEAATTKQVQIANK